MSASVTARREADELLAELHRLCERLPVPQPGWHPYVDQITSCRADFEHALALAAEQPAALELVAEFLDGTAEPAFEAGSPPELIAAWRRLEALPLPSGQHPYLDEILPALEAHRLLLIALGTSNVAP